ncbi:MAG: chorismate mutase [Acidobacteria bacterium]|nr:chorismate mutase [Acidobacteriota bacterium]
MNIDDWRRQIDEIDSQLLDLLNRRAVCSIEIGKLKQEMNLNILSLEREAEVVARALQHNQGPLDEGAIRRVFTTILEESRRLQELAAERASANEERSR